MLSWHTKSTGSTSSRTKRLNSRRRSHSILSTSEKRPRRSKISEMRKKGSTKSLKENRRGTNRFMSLKLKFSLPKTLMESHKSGYNMKTLRCNNNLWMKRVKIRKMWVKSGTVRMSLEMKSISWVWWEQTQPILTAGLGLKLGTPPNCLIKTSNSHLKCLASKVQMTKTWIRSPIYKSSIRKETFKSLLITII